MSARDEHMAAVLQLKAAEAWRGAREHPEIKAARQTALEGGKRARAQLRQVWMSGHMTGSRRVLAIVGQIPDDGGPWRAAFDLLAEAVEAGDFERAREMVAASRALS